jgi:IclR family acetate operon transcriptional repressor
MEENLTGVICVAAPIFDQSGRVIAGISLSGPSSRMEAKLAQVQEEVRASAITLSQLLSPNSMGARAISPTGKPASN